MKPGQTLCSCGKWFWPSQKWIHESCEKAAREAINPARQREAAINRRVVDGRTPNRRARAVYNEYMRGVHGAPSGCSARIWSRGMIYAIRAGDSGPIKFGVANEPLRRLAALQTGNAALLKLLVAVDVHEQNEKLIHRYLRGDRERGEWFAPTEKTLGLLDAMYLQSRDGECHYISDHIWDRDLGTVAWFRRTLGADFDLFESEVPRARAEGVAFTRVAQDRP